jgi:hypothetical protein
MDKKTSKPEAGSTPLMHTFNEKVEKVAAVHKKAGNPMKTIAVFALIAVLGIGSGFVLSKVTKATGNQIVPLQNLGTNLKGKTFGSKDTETFKDVAEGKLAEGGIEGEGQFHLVRPGGDSQNVYLTSSLVDLSQFVGKKIKVWGQTQKAQTAGWLMDVGRVEVL